MKPVPERPQRLAVKPSSAPALRVQASSFSPAPRRTPHASQTHRARLQTATAPVVMAGLRSALEYEAGDLWRAAVAIRMLAGQALAHVQERRSRAEEPPVESAR